MKPFLPFKLSGLLLGLVLLAAPLRAAQPNIVLVMTDDQGYGDVHCHGNTMIRTPNTDQLHSESVRLVNFHVDPTCTPTRSALMTGHYSTRAGGWHTVMGRSILFRDQVTMAQVLGDAGYRCGIFGKWHLGDNYPSRPQDRGFHEVLIHGGGGIGQTPDYWGNNYFDNMLLHNGEWKKYPGYCTEVFFDAAMQFIEQNKSRPFFVYLPTNVPHAPYNVAEKYSKPYRDKGVPENMANFYGMIENFDENLGRLRAHLKKLGLEENTIFIYLTDNGSAAGTERGAPGAKGKNKKAPAADAWPGFSAGMRGAKGSEYDGGHRVPFYIRWPAAGIGGGKDVPQLLAHIDVLPTLMDLAKVKAPKDFAPDGRSFVPLLKGNDAGWPDRTLFAHVQREEVPPKYKKSVAMTQRWRWVNNAELYDIQADPGEAKDVAAEHPDVVAKLKADYETWWSGLEARLKEYGWIVLGDGKENPAYLNCMDWHAPMGDVPWSQSGQGSVASLPPANGYWMVDVEKAGKYEFTLRHRPGPAEIPLQATQAKVKVGDVEASQSVAAGAKNVKVTLDLPAGRNKMQTWLEDPTAGKSRGAFYVEVRRLN